MTYSKEMERKILQERMGTPEFRKRQIQRLFERMADRWEGSLKLEHWYKDGSARLAFKSAAFGTVRVRIHWRDRPFQAQEMVRLEPSDGGEPVYVSPVPSAVIAVATR